MTMTMNDVVVPDRKKVGRPRAFQDEDVFRIMVQVVSKVGYSGLTFALIAEQIHCTTSALIRRFGDKQHLVQRFISWLTERAEANEAYISVDPDPMKRIYASWTSSRSDGGRIMPEMFLVFFIEARSNPAYRPQLGELTDSFRTSVTSSLQEAVQSGALVGVRDVDALGHLTVSAMIGAITVWMDHQSRDIHEVVDGCLDTLFSAYLPK
ncbi:MAG TPA: TetR/AcrR family transcriptional regulator [Thermomicrobiales bacterium]|nr:TetR/AcrR family transcriptional regulator [Thermomicrobiales bacterium]